MNIYRYPGKLPEFSNAVITVGTFDGVHKGHQKILHRMQELARDQDGESIVITFDPHPRSVIYPQDKSLRLLSTIEERLLLFERYGIDNVVIIRFTVEFSQLHPREYIESFLLKQFNPRAIVIGYDHRFGRNREGSVKLLREYAEGRDFQIIEIEEQELEQLSISSTKIREAVNEGRIRLANRLLNHPYMITGKVIHGKKIGKDLGFPTANLEISTQVKLLPPDGIYAVQVYPEHGKYQGMLYIGPRKTLGAGASHTVEVHILEFDEDIYGMEIRLDILEFLRKDHAFASLDKLQAQIRLDKEETLSFFNTYNEAGASVAMAFLNYNGRVYLEKYLTNWLEVSYPNSELVIIDNGSNDGSVEWLENHHPEIQCIRLEKNYGFAGGYNEGLQHLEYDYFALINTDVELGSDWIQPILNLMENDHTVAVCQPKILDARSHNMFEYAGAAGGWIDNFGYPFCRGRILHVLEEDQNQYDSTDEVFWASGAAFVIRADLYKRFTGFDADYFAHQEEIDLCWRLKRAGYRIMCCPESIVYHEGGGTLSYNQPRKIFLNFRNNIVTIIKNSYSSRLLWLFFMRTILDWLAALHFLIKAEWGNAFAIIRAQMYILWNLPAIVRKRWRDQFVISHQALSPRPNLHGLYHRSILLDFYLRKLRKFSDIPVEE